VAERFYGRRLTLYLRWQRVFAPARLHAATKPAPGTLAEPPTKPGCRLVEPSLTRR